MGHDQKKIYQLKTSVFILKPQKVWKIAGASFRKYRKTLLEKIFINKVNFEFFSGYKLNSGKVLERLNSWFWGSDAHIDNERFFEDSTRHFTRLLAMSAPLRQNQLFSSCVVKTFYLFCFCKNCVNRNQNKIMTDCFQLLLLYFLFPITSICMRFIVHH